MPISATGNNEAGFTLVELMVVMVIIGLMAAAVIVTIPDPRGRVSDDAQGFAARLVSARDLAIIGGRDVAVRVDSAGYGFSERLATGWTPVTAKALQPVRWGEGVAARTEVAGDVGGNADGRAALLFDTTGLATPAKVALQRGDTEMLVTVDAAGVVRVDAR